MNSNFVTLKSFEYELNCNCPERHPIYFSAGDILTIEEERRYVDGMGWYVLITINDEYNMFMFLEDIEHLRMKGTICAISDLDLRINYLRFKVNEALDTRDKEAFLIFSSELGKVMNLREGLMG
ncbi:IDEAL domain-containing protein [Ectobacillus funiculus]|uniref:IDEAL domain-containing protein n=1 Tax=Ectobacillus funiculus TaxID=137993 RepID=UPI00101CCA69|nr:IDEAL domain-containing protein [Ectobacillus funiculus]